MSSDRTANSNTNRPLKPTLASTRTARSPITPRVAGNATPPTKSTGSRPTPTIRSEPPTPQKKQNGTPIKNLLANGNVSPSSSTRAPRLGYTDTSTKQTDTLQGKPRPKSVVLSPGTPNERSGTLGAVATVAGAHNKAQSNRPKSFISDYNSTQAASGRSPGFLDVSPRSGEESSIDSRFFHASDVPKQEPKKAQFFHADGKQDFGNLSPGAQSPVLSAVSEQRPVGPWVKPDNTLHPPKSPTMHSPTLSALTGVSPFFTPTSLYPTKQPSPTSSKENIHLSYRKGASQIFGTRPSSSAARSTTSNEDGAPSPRNQVRLGAVEPSPPGFRGHHKSPSLSSITSSNFSQTRRRSTTTTDRELGTSPLVPEIKASTVPRISKPPQNLPTIDTSLESPGVLSRTESGLSPTKPDLELASEARRERKVLDLEISNNSLLAINASLERELRRQKAELKSFRRLSRAGRFSLAPGERVRTVSEDLSALAEESETDDYFGLSVGSAGVEDDDSSDDDDEESVASSADPLSPSAQNRLAKDEKRLRVDLEKHKELLMQSQAMNQSIKRCMYATEEMITEGKKALDYHVRVSDVKLGGRVLSNHEEREEGMEIEVEDDLEANQDIVQRKELLDAWTNVEHPSLEGSESGDRDSGIEVDRPLGKALPGSVPDSGRPPGLLDMRKFGSFSHDGTFS